MRRAGYLILAYVVYFTMTAPRLLGNAIITGGAMASFMALAVATIVLSLLYDSWKANKARAG